MKEMEKILIIDDEPVIRQLLGRIIGLEGYEVVQADSCSKAMKMVAKEKPDVILCDVFLPDGNGISLIPELKKLIPEGEIIMLTAHGNISDGVQAIKNGAFDYITKGDDNDKIIPLLARAMRTVKSRVSSEVKGAATNYTFDSIVSSSPVIARNITMAKKVAVTDVPVLITGETGTGKEVFARSLHNASHRATNEFVAVNCSAFSNELLESEMFGYKSGAFTGAHKDKPGLFEVANHGTIFLDEIGEMALELQAKLLRILESGEYIKVGDTKTTSVDVRVIAATNRNLNELIANGRFRSDLFYRLSVFQLELPPLRMRIDDISALAETFIEKYSSQFHFPVKGMTSGFVNCLRDYQWPGNIRELRNVIESSLIVSEGVKLDVCDLPIHVQRTSNGGCSGSELSMSAMEERHIRRVLEHTGGNKTEAARLLKIGLTTLYRKLDEYNI